MFARGRRVWTRPVLGVLVAAAVLHLPGGASTASAGLPDQCYHAVDGVDRSGLTAAPRSADRALVSAVRRSGGMVGPRVEPVGLRQVVWPSRAMRDAGLAALRRVPGVQFAEPEHKGSLHRSTNDPKLRDQWGLDKIGARRAWDIETGLQKDVTIAVLDTGVDFRHPDLAGRVLPGPNISGGNDDSQDDHMHGTHVAGIAAASTNNRMGVAGVSWGAKVLAVKVMDKHGSGTSCDVAVGIIEAAKREADVINLSLGFAHTCPLAFRAAVAYADHQGALVVASSGNSGFFASPQSAPANCTGVLGVGATDHHDDLTAFTTFGLSVDVSAPGEDILSTYLDVKKNKRGYAAFSGTSMSAPFVAGLAALLIAKHPDWTPTQVSDRIIATVDDLGPPGRDDYYGAGRINAAKALAG
ncbi:MAG TPA: S8 family serine peptidase [Mycobacteriales bacterium]|nr:S8 family serine peptidase [Mycobacteriales bacterium]